MSMTTFYAAFEDALAANAPGLEILCFEHNSIRLRLRDSGHIYCPLTFAALHTTKQCFSVGAYHDAGRKFQLTTAQRDRIAQSADNDHTRSRFSLKTRRVLLNILQPYLEKAL